MKKIYETINKIGYPIVLKPLDGNHGASINVTGKMLFLVWLFKEYSKRVIVENLLPVLILESCN
jgi:cyanophycin synthetase